MIIVITCITLSIVTNGLMTPEYGSTQYSDYRFNVLDQGRWSGMTKWGKGYGGIIIQDFRADEKKWSSHFVAGNWYWIAGYCSKFIVPKKQYINGYRVGYSSEAVVYLGFQLSDGTQYECDYTGAATYSSAQFTNWITVKPRAKLTGISGTEFTSIRSIQFQFTEIPPRRTPSTGVCEPDMVRLTQLSNCPSKRETKCRELNSCMWDPDESTCVVTASESLLRNCESKTKENKCLSSGKCVWIDDGEMYAGDFYDEEQILFSDNALNVQNGIKMSSGVMALSIAALICVILPAIVIVCKCCWRGLAKRNAARAGGYGSLI